VGFLIYLAGVPVPVDLVQQLARRLDGDVADKLCASVAYRRTVVALEPDERDAVLAVLDEAEEPPLAELREVLLAERVSLAAAVA
jgi:hypothetical protein